MAHEPLSKRTGWQMCEACGQDFEAFRGMWECPHCGYDNKVGEERGRRFSQYCTERSVEAQRRRREGE